MYLFKKAFLILFVTFGVNAGDRELVALALLSLAGSNNSLSSSSVPTGMTRVSPVLLSPSYSIAGPVSGENPKPVVQREETVPFVDMDPFSSACTSSACGREKRFRKGNESGDNSDNDWDDDSEEALIARHAFFTVEDAQEVVKALVFSLGEQSLKPKPSSSRGENSLFFQSEEDVDGAGAVADSSSPRGISIGVSVRAHMAELPTSMQNKHLAISDSEGGWFASSNQDSESSSSFVSSAEEPADQLISTPSSIHLEASIVSLSEEDDRDLSEPSQGALSPLESFLQESSSKPKSPSPKESSRRYFDYLQEADDNASENDFNTDEQIIHSGSHSLVEIDASHAVNNQSSESDSSTSIETPLVSSDVGRMTRARTARLRALMQNASGLITSDSENSGLEDSDEDSQDSSSSEESSQADFNSLASSRSSTQKNRQKISFICQHEGCGYSAIDNYHLKRHESSHATSKKDYTCPIL